MKKYISILLLVIFIVPSIAFASWWNLGSWDIFGFLHKKESSRQVPVVDNKNYEDKINELQKQIEELKNNQLNSSSTSSSIKDEVKSQLEKEYKAKLDKSISSLKSKTLSEKVGVSKEKLTACIKDTDTNSLQLKIQTSVENAMKLVPLEQRGTPYAIVIGSNGVKEEIRGAIPIDQVRKVIDEVRSGNVTASYSGEVSLSESGDHTLGGSNATVKIIEYSDLECPYCKAFHSTLKTLLKESNDISWTYRHWPIHQNSFEKLVAAECVAKLKGNDAFWKYVDLLFGMLNPSSNSVTDQL